jgi:hypothetical protein
MAALQNCKVLAGKTLAISSHHVKYVYNIPATAIDISLQLSISAIAIDMASPFKLPSQ